MLTLCEQALQPPFSSTDSRRQSHLHSRASSVTQELHMARRNLNEYDISIRMAKPEGKIKIMKLSKQRVVSVTS